MAFIFGHPVTGFSTPTDSLKAGFTTAMNAYVASAGRFGHGALRNTNAGSSQRLPVAVTGKVIVHWTLKYDTIPGTNCLFLNLFNNSGADSCLELLCTPTGQIRVEDANGTLVTSSAAGTLNANTHHVVVCEAEIGAASGTVRVWVDNMTTPVIDETGVDLTDAGGGTCDLIRWTSSVGDTEISQIFVYDTSGSTWNANVGDVRYFPMLPDGDDSTAWSPDTGTTNYDRVDDPLSAVADGDTSYVEATAASTIDLYTLSDLPGSVQSVMGVLGILEAKKTDAGAEPGPLSLRLAHSASTSDSPTLGTLTTDFLEYQNLFETPPGGGSWTPTIANALRAGPRIA